MNSLTEQQTLLQKQIDSLLKKLRNIQTNLNDLKSWQLDCDCLLKNQSYWKEMTEGQRHYLQQIVCQYGYWVNTTQPDESAKEYWNLLESYILKNNPKQWLLGLAEIRIYGLTPITKDNSFTESIAFLQMARQHSPSNERLNYAETVLTLSMFWQTLRTTLTTESDCRFHEVVKQWFRLLRETRAQFAHSTDLFIKTSLPLLLNDSCQCIESLIPRIHERSIIVLQEAKFVSPENHAPKDGIGSRRLA